MNMVVVILIIIQNLIQNSMKRFRNFIKKQSEKAKKRGDTINFFISLIFLFVGFVFLYLTMFSFFSLFFGLIGFLLFFTPLDWAINYLTDYDFSIISFATSEKGLRFFSLIGLGAPFAWLIFPTETLQKIKDECMQWVGLK